jgi:dipeptidyl aminopeptidase/acylaminoacyl peptidase
VIPTQLGRLLVAGTLALAALCLATARPSAWQTAQPVPPQAAAPAAKAAPVTPADYGKWQTLGTTALSDDGRWLAVPITRVDGTASLDLIRVAAAPVAPPAYLTASGGRAPAFSADSQWAAYRIGASEAEREKLQDDKKPVRDKLGLVRLDPAVAKPDPVVVADVTRFAFAPAAPYLAMLRYTPEGSKRAGADLLVRSLANGAVTSFGNVSDFAWQDEGRLLAFTIDAEGKAGNGVQVFDPQTGVLRLLDSGEAAFTGLTWREKDDDLACFRSRADEGFDGDTQVVLAWRDLSVSVAATPALKSFDHTADKAFPAGTRVVTFRRLQWAKDGKALYFGVQPWDKKPPKPAKDAGAADAKDAKPAPKDKPASVDVWHAKDERIIPMQRIEKTRDLERSYASVWRMDDGTWRKLGTDTFEQVTVVDGDRFAIETDRKPYIADNMFDRTRQDVYAIDLATGARTKAVDGVWYFNGASPGGRYLLYFKGDQYWTYEFGTGKTTNISAGLKAVWTDPDYDTPYRVQRPPSGVGGWLAGDAAVLVYDQHDIWRVAPDGSGGARITRGAEDAVQHRYMRVDRDDRAIDPQRPVYLNLFGLWTKKDGYARLAAIAGPGGTQPAVERLVWADKNVGNLTRARRADVYSYTVQDFQDPPAVYVGGPSLSDAAVMARTNTFQAGYAWGRSTLVEYKNAKGERLQGALYHPAGYVPGKTYPMIVYVYERLSGGVHNYAVPSERSPYNAAVFTAEGYFVLQPDVVFRPRDPGLSAVDCITAAVKAVLATGMVDPKRVGLVGHSWGGYEASFVPTQTGMFAASIAGAPITNLLSFYGAIHWNQGLPEPAHFETGQARMDVPFWVDLPAYIRNSSTLAIDKLKTPMLIFFGDKDGTVDFRQGVEMYNYARRAGKQLVMLVYADENHSATQKPNQIDYHRRILQWFGHYLKGDAAPAWITQGLTVIDAEKAAASK